MGHISSHLKPNDTSQKTSGFVGVENIFSCERCDYDTECEGQLKKHYEANIHSDVMSHAESNGMSHNLEEDNSDVEVVEEAIDHSINLVEDIPHEKPHEKVHQETQIIDDSNATDSLEQVNSDDKVQQNQPNQMTFICGECATSFEDETTINMHIETHGSSRHIQTRSVPTFKCDQCDHIYLKNEELKKHKVNVHKMYGCIYVCNGCDYKTSQITTFWAHKLKVHGDGPMQENNVSYGNLFLNVLASQQENMNDEIKKQKSEHNIEFQNIKKVHDILLNNIEVLTHKMNYVIANSDQIRSDNRSIYQTNLEKFKVMGVGMKAINDKIDNLQVKQNVTNKLNKQVLQNVTDSNVTSVKAFTIDAKDGAVRPDLNHKRIVPAELSKNTYDTLVLEGGVNEISNINTDGDFIGNIENWKKKVSDDSVNMFRLAEESLANNPKLKKVIILKRNFRCDNQTKQSLSGSANTVYDDLWIRKGRPLNISIADQKLQCEGNLRTLRYGNRNYDNYDGVHMRGKLSTQHYTRSIIDVFISAYPELLTPPTVHTTQAQYYTTTRYQSGNF